MKAGAHAFLGWLARGTQEMFDPLRQRRRDCFTAKSLRLPNGQTYRNFPIQIGPVFRAQVMAGSKPNDIPMSMSRFSI